jgi:hypothetical protein
VQIVAKDENVLDLCLVRMDLGPATIRALI